MSKDQAAGRDVSRNRQAFHLFEILDRFGNAIEISYDATHWTLTDSHSGADPQRKIVLTF